VAEAVLQDGHEQEELISSHKDCTPKLGLEMVVSGLRLEPLENTVLDGVAY
jgi:hypothetical protein